MARRTPDAEPTEPTATELRLAWCALVIRQEAGGGCLRDRERLAHAIRGVEVELLEGSWNAGTVGS
jgi:hypothetical protein